VLDARLAEAELRDFCDGNLEDEVPGVQALALPRREGGGLQVRTFPFPSFDVLASHVLAFLTGGGPWEITTLECSRKSFNLTIDHQFYNCIIQKLIRSGSRRGLSMGRLQDRVAIVTGAGQGVGRGVARAFAAEGARVVIANRTRQTGEEVAAQIEQDFGAAGARALYVETDVAREDSVRAMVDVAAAEFGGVDVLVNNATPAEGMDRLERMTTDAMQQQTRVNYFGSFWAMQAVFPHMKERGWGRIINMGSLNGINAHKYTTGYNGSKEALRALTRTAAVEWGRHGITCNVICPFAATPPWEAFVQYDPEGAQQILDTVPSRRAGDSETDVGPVAVFLASDESRFVTGNTIHADGGGHINGVPWSFELPE